MQEHHREKARKANEKWQEKHEQLRKDEEPEARRVLELNPLNSWARDVLGLPHLTRKEEDRLRAQMEDRSKPKPSKPFDVDSETPPDGIDKSLWASWVHALRAVHANMFTESFDTWIRPLRPVAREGGTWTVQAPHSFSVSWVQEHHLNDLRDALGEGSAVRFVVGDKYQNTPLAKLRDQSGTRERQPAVLREGCSCEL